MEPLIFVKVFAIIIRSKQYTYLKLHVPTSITLHSKELFLNLFLLSSTLLPSRACTLPLGAEEGRISPHPLTLPLALSLLLGLLLVALLRPSSLLLSPFVLFLPPISFGLLLLPSILIFFRGFGFGRLGFLSSFRFLLWRSFLGLVFGAGLVFVGAAAGFVFFADFGGLKNALLVGGP